MLLARPVDQDQVGTLAGSCGRDGRMTLDESNLLAGAAVKADTKIAPSATRPNFRRLATSI